MKNRYEEVSKQYEQDRRTVILPLGIVCMVALSCILGSKCTNYGDYFQNNTYIMEIIL